MTEEAIPEVVVTAPAETGQDEVSQAAPTGRPEVDPDAQRHFEEMQSLHRNANLQTARAMVAGGATPEHAASWLVRQAGHIWETVEHALADILS